MTENSVVSEREILQRVETAIEEVVRSDPQMVWEDEGNNTKRQKYIHNVVSEFSADPSDPPVTSSWFRYGKSHPFAPSGVGNLGDDQELIPTSNSLSDTDLESMKDFLKSDECHPPLTEKWWGEKSKVFLEEYYTHKADPGLKPLYLSSTRLRIVMDETRHDIARIDDFGFNERIDRTEEVKRHIADIHLALAGDEQLRESLPLMREVTHLIKDAFLMLAQIEPDELGSVHIEAMKALDKLYDDVIWEYPSAIMSERSAVGPNAGWVETTSSGLTERFANYKFEVEDSFEYRLALKSCREANLIPSVTDYPSEPDDLTQAVEGVMRVGDAHLNDHLA